MEPRKRFNLVNGIKTATLIVVVAALAGVLDHMLSPPRQAMPVLERTAAPAAPSAGFMLPPDLRANSAEVPPPPPSF